MIPNRYVRGRILAWCAAGLMAAGVAAAQDIPPAPPRASAKSTAQLDAGEPRADTSMPVPAQGAPAQPAAAQAPAAPAALPRPAGAQPAAAPPKAPGRPVAGQPPRGASDRVDLNTATVTGDREQPKVMYIVPWKRSDIGDLSGKPMNSLLDEALAPIDRDEFKREVAYYDALKADAPHNGASNPAPQGEK